MDIVPMSMPSNPFQSNSLRPSEYINNSIVSRSWRFQATTPAGYQVYSFSASKLGALQSMVTVLNTTAVQIYESVRIRRIQVWGTPLADGTNVNISLSYPGQSLGVQGPDRNYSATSMGGTFAAYIVAKPGKFSQAAQWQNTSTNTAGGVVLFSIGASTGNFGGTDAAEIVVEVDLAMRMTNDVRVTNNTVPLLSGVGVLGQLYYLPLDNNCGAALSVGGIFKPDPSLVQTF